MKLNKEQIGKILGILVTALIALLAVFGYDVGVVRPREQAQVVAMWALSIPAETGAVTATVCERGCDYTSVAEALGVMGADDVFWIAAGTYPGVSEIEVAEGFYLRGADVGQVGVGW